MKKALKWIAGIMGVLLLGSMIAIQVISEDRPDAVEGPEAEALVDEVFAALNKPAWDSLRYVSWTFFRGQNHYKWDKLENKARIEWDDIRVDMDLNTLQAKISRNGKSVSEQEYGPLKDEAWAKWCNDSFWLYAPFKMRDKGTTRALVNKDGKRGVMVSYASGGTTPGDSYLWWIGEDGKPTSYQMWVSIIPVKGMETTWHNWKSLEGGAQIALSHTMTNMEMSLSNLKSGMTPQSIGLPAQGL